jgi:opine dehydrogenase
VSRIAVLGAGAGGRSTAIELAQAGHEVRLWNRNPRTVAALLESRAVAFRGVLGEGTEKLALVTTALDEALRGAEAVVVCLPALAHGAIFADLATARCSVPVILNPGHTGGALHARAVFSAHGTRLPPLAELSTLTYVARVQPDGIVSVTCRAGQVRCGVLPGGQHALEVAHSLFPAAVGASDVLASSLSNVNLVLHPPGAILAAAWVEAPERDFTFYVDALTPGVARVIATLDDERRAVAAGFGHDLPGLAEEMALIGTVSEEAAAGDVGAAIRSGDANRLILAPRSLAHRYYEEDLPFALVPFAVLAAIAGVAVPTAHALLRLGGVLLDRDLFATGLDASRLGLDGLVATEVEALVRDAA